MKKTFANLVQKSLVTALLVFGALLIGTSRSEAQSSGSESWPTSYALPISSWVDLGEAMLRIKTDVLVLNGDPSVEVIGSDSYIRAHYYKFVYHRLDAGEPIHSAIISPLATTTFRTANETIPGVSLSQGQRGDLINSMKNRLAL